LPSMAQPVIVTHKLLAIDGNIQFLEPLRGRCVRCGEFGLAHHRASREPHCGGGVDVPTG
jgi:ribosomal protein S27AE